MDGPIVRFPPVVQGPGCRPATVLLLWLVLMRIDGLVDERRRAPGAGRAKASSSRWPARRRCSARCCSASASRSGTRGHRQKAPSRAKPRAARLHPGRRPGPWRVDRRRHRPSPLPRPFQGQRLQRQPGAGRAMGRPGRLAAGRHAAGSRAGLRPVHVPAERERRARPARAQPAAERCDAERCVPAPATKLPAQGLHAELPDAAAAQADAPLSLRHARPARHRQPCAGAGGRRNARGRCARTGRTRRSAGASCPPARGRRAGFSARWAVSSLASARPTCRGIWPMPGGSVGSWPRLAGLPGHAGRGLLRPREPLRADRPGHQVRALLFIVLTFACVALAEVLARPPRAPGAVHAGRAWRWLFYLLLLSLSEHVAFGTAYAVASAACVRCWATTRATCWAARRAGAAFGAGMALLYGALWYLLLLRNRPRWYWARWACSLRWPR
jgi:hypothetical protein